MKLKILEHVNLSFLNHAYLSAMPFHHTQLYRELPQPRMFELGVGKGRHVHKLIYASIQSATITALHTQH